MSNPIYLYQDAVQELGTAALDAAGEHLLWQVLHRVRRLELRRPPLGDLQLRPPGKDDVWID